MLDRLDAFLPQLAKANAESLRTGHTADIEIDQLPEAETSTLGLGSAGLGHLAGAGATGQLVVDSSSSDSDDTSSDDDEGDAAGTAARTGKRARGEGEGSSPEAEQPTVQMVREGPCCRGSMLPQGLEAAAPSVISVLTARRLAHSGALLRRAGAVGQVAPSSSPSLAPSLTRNRPPSPAYSCRRRCYWHLY